MDEVIWGDGEKMTVGDPVILKNVSSDSITDSPTETSFEERFSLVQALPNIRGGVSQRGVQKGGPGIVFGFEKSGKGRLVSLDSRSLFSKHSLVE
uniref:Uncharacterized protein n=1 Tax=Cannabis sativa TaxID=3483 RepID=A0A803Q965_CANSA